MTTTELFNQVLQEEAQAIMQNLHKNDVQLPAIIDKLYQCSGKIIICGVGKSALVGRKITATLNSTGSPSVFLHAGEAFHGDLGVCDRNDVAIFISKSGTTIELLKLIPIFKSFEIPIIAMVGNLHSPLAAQADFVLDACVAKEADLENLAPTTSSTLTLAMGDAMAVCLMQKRNFKKEDFARFHPGGQLGKNLLYKVRDVMHPYPEIAIVQEQDSVKDVLIRMTEKPLGAACVVNEEKHLVGIVTDGDIRRLLLKTDDIRSVKVIEVMTANPQYLSENDTLMQAIQLMEHGERKISVVPIVEQKTLKGLLRIHDVY